jgi:2-keto-4-pentenoate hydratase
MSKSDKRMSNSSSLAGIAEAFVNARKKGIPLIEYPGTLPATLQDAYHCQDKAINLWGDKVAGWKVGRIPDPLIKPLGCHRLAGPIFKDQVWPAEAGKAVSSEIIRGGFAAVEAEFLLILGEDAPNTKTSWTIEEASYLVSSANIGVEIAASPYSAINIDGPTCVVSDFGNNAGVIVGPEIAGWKSRPFSEWKCSTYINGKKVGEGTAEDIPNGPFESLRFLLELTAKRGMPLKQGCIISTGAVTGIHDIFIGDSSEVFFGSDGTLRHEAVAQHLTP